MLNLPARIGVTREYGPLRAGLSADLDPGYSVLVGENNSGKSALLQYLFLETQVETPNDRATLIQSNRALLPNAVTPQRTLVQWNSQFVSEYRGRPRLFDGNRSPDPAALHALLMHADLLPQLEEFTSIVRDLGFGKYEVNDMQMQSVSSRAVSEVGSGLRALFPILAAITNPRLAFILIDEPEFALEAKIQKRLRELFLQKAAEGKNIVVATHSHLFVNWNSPGHNYRVTRQPDAATEVSRLSQPSEMLEVSCNLLGNSPSDLFFPENFLIVEGASDQVVVDRARELCGISQTQVKVLSATSLGRVRGLEEAVTTALRPLVADWSPYHNKVVCLIDGPNETNRKLVEELRRTLGDRLIELDKPSLEEYLPEQLYSAAGRDKKHDLEKIDLAKRTNNYRAVTQIKEEISTAIASVLSGDHLDLIPEITDAVRGAAPADAFIGGARLG